MSGLDKAAAAHVQLGLARGRFKDGGTVACKLSRERTIIKRIHVIGEPAADVAQHKDMQAKPDIQQVHVRPYEIIIKATYG